ncbi:TPA: MerR family transcriptional regulator [Streptococcus suis]
MSVFYTTGELAKLADVSVRTVQYYDQRGILSPTELTEGGRRLYTEEDLDQLQTICFLRDLDFSIDQIKCVLAEENASQVLELLLEDHIIQVKTDLDAQKAKLDRSVKLLDTLKRRDSQSLEFIKDISITMKNQKAWKKLHKIMWSSIIGGIAIYVILLLWITSQPNTVFWRMSGIVLGICYVLGMLLLANQFRKKVTFLCSNCHTTFDPSFKEFNLAAHTPKTRKLTCPHCHTKSYCLELAKETK